MPSRGRGKRGFASDEPKQERESERREAKIGEAEESVILSSQREPLGGIRSGAMLSWERRGEAMSVEASPKGEARVVEVAGEAVIAEETGECDEELRREVRGGSEGEAGRWRSTAGGSRREEVGSGARRGW